MKRGIIALVTVALLLSSVGGVLAVDEATQSWLLHWLQVWLRQGTWTFDKIEADNISTYELWVQIAHITNETVENINVTGNVDVTGYVNASALNVTRVDASHYVNASLLNASRGMIFGNMTIGNLTPRKKGESSLGLFNYHFGDAYINTLKNIANDDTIIGFGSASITVYENLYPYNDKNLNLGTPLTRWKDFYIGGVITDVSHNVTVRELDTAYNLTTNGTLHKNDSHVTYKWLEVNNTIHSNISNSYIEFNADGSVGIVI